MRIAWVGALIGLLSGVFRAEIAVAGPTIEAVKARGTLVCGISSGSDDFPAIGTGFAAPDDRGAYHGLDIDLCRALAAAVLGQPEKVEYDRLTGSQQVASLRAGKIDVLSPGTSWMLTRETSGVLFGPTMFYDGQSFIVQRRLNVHHPQELNGATICLQPETTTALTLADYGRRFGLQFKPVAVLAFGELAAAFYAGRCDAYMDAKIGC